MGDVEASKSEFTLYSPGNKGKGSFKACMFIYVLAALENMGFIANMVSLVLYFMFVMYFDIPKAANTVTNFMGSTFMLCLFGGFISDTYLDRFRTVVIFTAVEILALVLLTIQAYSKHMHPADHCDKPGCAEGKRLLYAALCFLALGSGAVRGSFPALGADQFDANDRKEAKNLASYFNWLVLSVVLGATIGVTGIVWVAMNKAWYKAFVISTVGVFVGLVVLVSGKHYYRLRQPGDSPLLRIIQVIVVAVKNRKSSLPDKADALYELTDKETVWPAEKIPQTDQFRFLDRAAILQEDSKPTTPWTVCTVTQIEEAKIIIRMSPILLSTVIMNTCLAQLQTFSVAQGSLMNLNLRKFAVPAPSVPVIPLLFMVILVPLYDLVFVPFARKITGHPSGITQLQRVGVGLVLSIISMGVAGIVELKRRNQANRDLAHPISIFWLSFQYGIFGIADMFTLVGLMEFFYKEAPAGMKSLSTSFTFLSMSLGYFLSSVLVDIVNAVTRRVTRSKQGWLHGTYLNDNNLDLFYWFLAILSTLNFLNYLYWASWYKYKSTPTIGSEPEDKTDAEPESKPEAKANAESEPELKPEAKVDAELAQEPDSKLEPEIKLPLQEEKESTQNPTDVAKTNEETGSTNPTNNEKKLENTPQTDDEAQQRANE